MAIFFQKTLGPSPKKEKKILLKSVLKVIELTLKRSCAETANLVLPKLSNYKVSPIAFRKIHKSNQFYLFLKFKNFSDLHTLENPDYNNYTAAQNFKKGF
jgi:hypothetical protein